MKKLIASLLVCLVVVGAVGCFAVSSVSADENYIDNSNEYSPGDGTTPDDGMAREEPRTRFKDV